jgi:uncharacterized membrane protein
VSERAIERAIVVLAVIGVGISGYLTYVHYADIEPFCTGISDCERVQTSDYADVAGVPVAVLGLIGYLSILAVALWRSPLGRLATVYFTYVGLGFSAYLTWVELAEIDAICQWCIASAVVMAALAGLATWRQFVAGPPIQQRRPQNAR